MSNTQYKFIVMHDKGEDINGVNIRPYESFKSVMTDDYEKKVKKGFLILDDKKSKSRSKKRSAHK